MAVLSWPDLGKEGEVKLLLAPCVEEALAILAEEAETRETVFVSKLWHRIPAQDVILDECLQVLAEVALSLWPYWHGEKFEPGRTAEAQVLNRLRARELSAKRDPAISSTWLRAAMHLCQQQRLPVVPGIQRAIQVQQLAKAIAPRELTLALATDEPEPAPSYLLGLAKAATWLADHSQARLVLVVPSALAAHPELASVSYGALQLPLPERREEFDSSVQVVVGCKGSPHPFSLAEKKLAERVAADPQLKDLLEFNQVLQSVTGQSFRADLLWREGKVVVEVDGPEHCSRDRYYQDRLRDYQLLISGYLVLRIPNDLVMSDCERAVEMIRKVIQQQRSRL
ncbi:DUF559 domain-containing protein [Synechococcus sp. H60.2]|uniref:endonuclease domain-containing protein n=1 Tax=Synechococcus sp. H60.2 TaxID=2964518 RepID=UPI0039C093E4